MNRLPERIEQIVAFAQLETAEARSLLERYVGTIDWTAPWPWRTVYRETATLRRFIEVLERVQPDELSVEMLNALERSPATSEKRALQQAIAVRRVRRLLQASGELPSSRELAAAKRITRKLASVADHSRALLTGWVNRRARELCLHELEHELRRLVALEEVAVDHPGLADDALVTLWLQRIVKRIVDCPHAPVTRAENPLRCNRCGATPSTHGTRVSPAARKQRELRALGRRYLVYRERHA